MSCLLRWNAIDLGQFVVMGESAAVRGRLAIGLCQGGRCKPTRTLRLVP
jgi:hypothetical protein